ncbi:MAG: GAF domain-containing protein, partial [Polyangiaceae bacterium]
AQAHIASAPPPAPMPAPMQQPVQRPAPIPAPVAAAPPAPVEQVMQTPTPGPTALTQSGATGSYRRVRKPTPSAPDGAKIRVRGDELIALLFEEMHDLSFMADSLEGAAFCLWVVLDKLPSRAAFVHFYDLEKREFVVASVAGGAGVEHAARRNSPNDPWLAEAMRRRTVYVTADATSHEGANVERFAAIGGARSVVVAPVMLGGRMLGAIEVVNPIDGNPFGEDDANAIQYMAEQFAEFVSSHGIVIDESRIRRASLNPPA